MANRHLSEFRYKVASADGEQSRRVRSTQTMSVGPLVHDKSKCAHASTHHLSLKWRKKLVSVKDTLAPAPQRSYTVGDIDDKAK